MQNYSFLNPDVSLTEDGMGVILKIKDYEIIMDDPQVNELIQQLLEAQKHAKAIRNGWIFVA